MPAEGRRRCRGLEVQLEKGVPRFERSDIALQQAVVIPFGVVEKGFVHVDGRAVMGVDERKAQHHGIYFRENVADGPKIAEGFAHFFAIDVDKTVVQPMVDHGRMPGVALTLTDLCFVMRESQVVPAAVDVKLLSKVIH